ncbi:hypothetical protein [Rhodococcus koreensis]
MIIRSRRSTRQLRADSDDRGHGVGGGNGIVESFDDRGTFVGEQSAVFEVPPATSLFLGVEDGERCGIDKCAESEHRGGVFGGEFGSRP